MPCHHWSPAAKFGHCSSGKSGLDWWEPEGSKSSDQRQRTLRRAGKWVSSGKWKAQQRWGSGSAH